MNGVEWNGRMESSNGMESSSGIMEWMEWNGMECNGNGVEW